MEKGNKSKLKNTKKRDFLRLILKTIGVYDLLVMKTKTHTHSIHINLLPHDGTIHVVYYMLVPIYMYYIMYEKLKPFHFA